MRIIRGGLWPGFVKHKMPFVVIVVLDCLACAFGELFLLWALTSGERMLGDIIRILHSVGIFCICNLVGFRLFRTYAGILRYSTMVDIKKVVWATAVSYCLAYMAEYAIHLLGVGRWFCFFSYKILFLMYVAGMVLMILLRVVINLTYDSAYVARNAKSILVYGTSEAIGISALIHSEKPVRFLLKGFLTDERAERGARVAGKRVYGVEGDVSHIIHRLGIQALIVAPSKQDAFRRNEQLQGLLMDAGVKIYFYNGASQKDGGAQIAQMRMEDLLPRDEIGVDVESIAASLKGQRVLITGSAGSIGSELVRQVASFEPEEMILIDSAETPQHAIRLQMAKDFPNIKAETIVTSICREDRMEKIFREHKPAYVFHAAAYKHVPMMEDNPSEAILNNVVGTRVIADLSVRYGVKKFVMISTDKAVNPSSVMGCSKRICEIYAQSLDGELKAGRIEGETQFVTTRFGNVLGSNGSVIHLFREQLEKGGPLTVTHPDIIRYFMLIPEACKLVLEAGVKGEGGEIFVFDMGMPIRIVDLAKRMIELSGRKDVEICYTGLRQGEKLYEEVLDDGETTLPSFHSKIRIAQVRDEDYRTVCREIEQLVMTAHTGTNDEIVGRMEAMVPEYKPLNSVYK